jgi:hypothetical protein
MCLVAAVEAVQLKENKQNSLTTIMAEKEPAPLSPWWDENDHADVYTEDNRKEDEEAENERLKMQQDSLKRLREK